MMKKFGKAASLVLALVMMVTCFAGCGSKKTDSDKIVIGGIGPITGAAAIYGQAAMNGAKLAVEEINAKGEDLQFTFLEEDDEHDAEKSVNAYNTLKDKGMQILMGTVTTTPCIAVSQESYNDRIFTLSPSASSTDVIGGQPDANGNVTIARKDNVFQMCFTDPNQGTASAKYVSEQKLGTKIAVIYNNADAYSTGIYQKFEDEAERLGLEIVSTTTFSDDTTDFTTQVSDAKNNDADLIFLPIYYTPASLIFSAAAKMDYHPKYFGVDGMDGILTLEGFDTSLAEGVMLLTPFSADAEDDLTKNFVTNFKEKYGDTPNQFAADGYDCIYAIYNACKKGNITADMSAEDICEKLIEVFTADDFTFDGLTGSNISWSDTGEASKEPKGMIIQDGAYVGM